MIRLLCLSLGLLASTLFAAEDEAVRIEKNVEYLGADRVEKAYLYLPTHLAAGERCPAVLIIHGGGWVSGDKGAAREINIGTNLAHRGYVGMSINYLLATEHDPKPVWPQNVYDCKTAVRWLRKNADRLQIDPAHIGVIGGSAGGHLAALLAVTQPEAGLDPSAPYGDLSCQVQCAVDFYGPMLWFEQRNLPMFGKKRMEAPELYRSGSPLSYIGPNTPPILIAHGTADTTVALDDSKAFDQALTKAGVEHQLVIVEGAPHSFDLQPKQQDLRALVIGFFDRHLRPASSGGANK